MGGKIGVNLQSLPYQSIVQHRAQIVACLHYQIINMVLSILKKSKERQKEGQKEKYEGYHLEGGGKIKEKDTVLMFKGVLQCIFQGEICLV